MTSRTRLATALTLGATAALPMSVAASSYIVRPGDTLSEIAVRHGTTIEALAKANEIGNPDVIRVGQMLQIPDASLGLPRYTTDEGDNQLYAVQAGDSVIGIARHFGVDATALARTNGIGVNAPLTYGTELHVPGRLARVNALLTQVSNEHDINASLIRAVAWMESGWQQDVVSATGAVGLMQVEPYTGDWVSKYLSSGKLNIHVAADNVQAGTLLLKHLLSVHGGDASAALAAYYQGDASIARNGLYDDTRRYVRVVQEILTQE